MRSLLSCAALAAAVLFAQNGPETALPPNKQFSKRVVISGLDNPWEITWGPDNWIWTTERTGKRITRVNPATGEAKVAITIDEVSAPGGQDGLLGLAIDGNTVYAYYTYVDQAKGADPNIKDPASPYRFLYGKIVRLAYDSATQTLAKPVTLIDGLPAGNDHNGGRLKIGPDKKLYLSIGDQGHNQLGNFCLAVEAQRLPTAKELAAKDYSSYVGKTFRLNLDGSVPADNPRLNGVVSHVFTYGHRNPQGIDFGPDGTLYESEHGPKTDDEVNVLVKGGNYGWPNVAGFRDNKAYQFARWAEASTPCSQLRFSDLEIHPSVPRADESAFKPKMQSPLATLFTVPTGFNFQDPACKGINFICWPTVGVSGVEHYNATGIPGWKNALLATALKRGSLYVIPLKPNGQQAAGPIYRFFHSENRFRDTAVSPDGKTIFVATDPGGLAESSSGGTTTKMEDPGAILAFTYMGEGSGKVISLSKPGATAPAATANKEDRGPLLTRGFPPRFTAAQAAAGRTSYNERCAVCHGSNMTNGTFGTPLGGDYYKSKWSNRSVGALFTRSQKTMPPAAPGSLPAETYANIVAYILETNGAKPGDKPLDPASPDLPLMQIP